MGCEDLPTSLSGPLVNLVDTRHSYIHATTRGCCSVTSIVDGVHCLVLSSAVEDFEFPNGTARWQMRRMRCSDHAAGKLPVGRISRV
jgi:hypothetical protein